MAVEWKLAFISIFSVIFFKMVCLSGPETLPPLVDQRVAASKPVHDVFRKNHSPAQPPPKMPSTSCAPRAS
jgi:hypothetical protein